MVIVQVVITDVVVVHSGRVSVVKVAVKSEVGMGLPMIGWIVSTVEVGMTVLAEAADICVAVEVTSACGSRISVVSGPVVKVGSFAQ